MILPDVNLLVYAVDENSPFHQPAKAWLEGHFNGGNAIGFTWQVLLGFLRLTTRPALLKSPLTADQALDLIEDWCLQPAVFILEPGPRHFAILRSLLAHAGAAGNLTSDAHLAAIAIEHDAELHSNDSDFGRFPGLRWLNPLAAV